MVEGSKLCEYGCGKVAKFQLKNGKWCCSKRVASCEGIRKKNSVGCKKSYQEKRRVCVFTDEQRQKGILKKKKDCLEQFLTDPKVYYSSENLKMYMLGCNIPYKCSSCGISKWKNNPITLEIDHIDGVRHNNNLSNLRFLCPNCHSQTKTWRGRSSNTGKVKVSDEDLICSLKKHKSIRRALLEVGLAPKGENYTRARELLNK